MKSIPLKRPITMPPAMPGGTAQRWATLDLRDIEAGDICDAGREMPDGASQTEMQLRVAAKCCDLPFVILRKVKPVDIVQLEVWWREQWESVEAANEENPSKADATRPVS